MSPQQILFSVVGLIKVGKETEKWQSQENYHRKNSGKENKMKRKIRALFFRIGIAGSLLLGGCGKEEKGRSGENEKSIKG